MGIEASPAEKYEIIREVTQSDNNLLKICWLWQRGFHLQERHENAAKIIKQTI